jgi:hypothetical protein
MPNEADKNSGDVRGGAGRLLRNLILLALPCVSFQREILAIIKEGLAKDKKNSLEPFQNLVSRELHALMMILDRSQELRSLLGENLERELQAELPKIFSKLAAGSVSLIEAQEALLKAVSEILLQLKNGNKPKSQANAR